MIRILLADQTEIVRYAISRVLRGSMDNIFIKEVANVQQLIEQLHEVSYDLIITEFLLPGWSMFDIIPEMRKHRPDAYILVISDLAEDVYAVRVIKAGAAGLLHRTAGIADLVSAVKKVLAGQKYLSKSIAELLLGALRMRRKNPVFQDFQTRNLIF